MDAKSAAYRINREHFKRKVLEKGFRTEVLWTGGDRSQRDRFEAILRVVPNLTGKEVLDIGCGFGDLYAFLKELGLGVHYIGIDICEEMVEEGKQRHPDATFELTGVLEMESNEPVCDVSVASGLFTFDTPSWEDYVVATLRRMLELSREAVVANFLSSHSKAPDAVSHYVEPGSLLTRLMKDVTPWVVLLHDYRWNDFTVTLYREPCRPGG